MMSTSVNIVRAPVTTRTTRTTPRRSSIIVRAEPPSDYEATTPHYSRYQPPLIPVTLSVQDAFSFIAPIGTVSLGSGPELMNGRLAMIAFVSATGAELATGKAVGEQIDISPIGVTTLIAGVIASTLITYCANKELTAPLLADVELINGRAAMVGFASLIAIEAVSGQALF